MSSKVCLIVCCCLNNGIGKNGTLPWSLPKEMKYFAKITTYNNPVKKNVVIMGRKTWQSIPNKFKPLKNRINVVLSRNVNFNDENYKIDYVFSDLRKSISFCKNLDQVGDIFLIGGEQVYQNAIELDLYDRIYITRIFHEFDCDAFFPILNLKKLKKINLKEVDNKVQNENGLKYQYQIFEKI